MRFFVVVVVCLFFPHNKTLDFITILQLLPGYFVKLVSSKKKKHKILNVFQ